MYIPSYLCDLCGDQSVRANSVLSLEVAHQQVGLVNISMLYHFSPS